MHHGRKAKIIGAIVIIGLIAVFVTAYRTGWKIIYAPDLEDDWEAISATAAWVGTAGTIVVLWYNHKAIQLTQRSVQQSIDLQLYDKRQAIFDETFTELAFLKTSPNIKILYSDEIYSLHKQISELCHNRYEFIFPFIAFKIHEKWNIDRLYNVCKPTIDDILDFIELQINFQEQQKCWDKETVERTLKNVQIIKSQTKEIEEKIQLLQKKMEDFLKKSIGNE